jgi:hypothetical protein
MRPGRLIPLAGCALLVGVLPACGSDGGDSAPTASPAARVSRPPAVTRVQVPPGTGKGYVGARSDVTVQSCTGSAGTWTVKGTVTNSSTKAADYRIYTSFLSADQDTRGLVETDVVRVAPRARVPWTGRLPLSDSGLRCVLRVERTARP